jgi:hypothetical protein
MRCPLAEEPLIRTLIPLVVKMPFSGVSGAAERFAVVWSLATDVPSSVSVSALKEASSVPEPVVEKTR